MTDPMVLRDVAIRIAEETSLYLSEEYGRDHRPDTKSSAADFVTEIDRESERRIVSRLAMLRPGDGVLGEEGTDHQGTSGVRWIIDPIDGTTNFVYGQPGFSVSIAASVEGQVVAGAVADPVHREVFDAALDCGARLNGATISARPTADLDRAVLATGFGFLPEVRQSQAEILARVASRVGNFRRFGSAAIDLCWVGCGRVDGYWERGLNAWDYSAGALIAAEAGARVHGGSRPVPSTHMVVAMAPGIDVAATALLAEAGAFDH